jgi:WD40 repeat protein
LPRWSPDGTRLASAANDKTVRVWDPETGTELHQLSGHTNSVVSVAWSPDGTRLASASEDGVDPVRGYVDDIRVHSHPVIHTHRQLLRVRNRGLVQRFSRALDPLSDLRA